MILWDGYAEYMDCNYYSLYFIDLKKIVIDFLTMKMIVFFALHKHEYFHLYYSFALVLTIKCTVRLNLHSDKARSCYILFNSSTA